jgi:CubicO group peptidase (beta-lactamase class C family)
MNARDRDLAPAYAALDAFVAARMKADGTPGLALALTDRDRVLHVATYGRADIVANTPVTPETLFETGSIGKSFTADALLILAERGRVDLDAPVTDYLPWFAVRSRFGPITLHHLLTHTAGIIAGPDGTPSGLAEVWALRETETGSPPGARCHYSNVGYKILGLVVARASGWSYPEAIRRLILEPLGLERSAAEITNDVRSRLAEGYTGLYDDRPFQPKQPLVAATWLETDTGDGCLAMPPADLADYARLLLNRGRAPAGPLYSEASFARKTTAHAEMWPGYGYGYGIIRNEEEGRTILGHTGGMIGHFAYVRADLDAGLGVGVMVNGPGSPGTVSRHALALLRAALLGEPLPAAPPIDSDPADLASFLGTYRRVEGRGADAVVVAASPDERRLCLRLGEETVPLEPYDDDTFLIDHPIWSRFQLGFERDDAGAVAGFTHGDACYAIEGTTVEPTPSVPADWRAFVGLFRSFNPWCPIFRVVARRGRLWLIFPSGPDGFADEQPLTLLAEPAHFRAGDDPEGPETVTFDVVVEDRALRATLSGAAYWRVEAS